MSAAPDIPDDSQPVSVEVAARELGVSGGTVRRWIRDGAPCVRLGEPGRGNGSLVQVSALREWARGGDYSGEKYRVMSTIANVLLDAHRRDAGVGMPAHRYLGFSDEKSAVYLLLAYDRLHWEFTGEAPEPKDAPEAINQLLQIVGSGNRSQMDGFDSVKQWNETERGSQADE